MSQQPALPHERLAAAMETRAYELGLNLADISRQAPITMETLRAIRRGKNTPSPTTMSKLERVLRWKFGSIKAMYEGGEPTPLPEGPPEPEPALPTTPKELAEHIERRLAEESERQDAKMAKITEALRSVLGDDATEKLLETLEDPPNGDRRRDAAG